MSKTKVLIWIILYLLNFSIQIQADSKHKIKLVRYKLENGLTVILHKDVTRPIVSIGMMYHVGSKDEDPNRTGFAHFFEHLMFEGTKNIKRGGFDKLIFNAGGESNAYTTFDCTYYEMSLPSNQLPLALWVESERLLHLKIDKEGVETQRKVVKEERREKLDNQAYGNLDEILFSLVFQKHPYKWLPVGSNQYIDKATLQEFDDFHDKFYIPGNAVLVIAGDIKIRTAKKMIKTYFSRIPKSDRKIIREKIKEPPIQKEIKKTVYYNIEFPAFSYAFHSPAQGTEDFYPFIFIDQILSGGESARLNQRLKIKDGLIINLETAYRAMEEYGLYSITCYAKKETKYKNLESGLNEEIHKLQTQLITDRELEKARNRIQRVILESNSNLSGITENLAEYEIFFGNASIINSEYEKVLAVTNNDILRVAKKYLTLDKKIVLQYLSPKNK